MSWFEDPFEEVSGKFVWCDLDAHYMRDDSGKVTKVVCTISLNDAGCEVQDIQDRMTYMTTLRDCITGMPSAGL